MIQYHQLQQVDSPFNDHQQNDELFEQDGEQKISPNLSDNKYINFNESSSVWLKSLMIYNDDSLKLFANSNRICLSSKLKLGHHVASILNSSIPGVWNWLFEIDRSKLIVWNWLFEMVWKGLKGE